MQVIICIMLDVWRCLGLQEQIANTGTKNPSVSPLASQPPARSFNRRSRHCRARRSFHSPTAGRFALRASAHWARASLRRPFTREAKLWALLVSLTTAGANSFAPDALSTRFLTSPIGKGGFGGL